MNWTLDKTRPICPQLCEIICINIANGNFSAGQKILSIREIALLAGVNPNTVQKSFEELERRGVIHSIRCSGWYVNNSIDAAKNEVRALQIKKAEDYLTAMSQLGCNLDEMIKYLYECQGDKQ
jgi:DNA-binding transcriptional regulator YhcF (GntR family)